MGYRNKVISAGEIYHVTQRAPGKEKLFVEDSDYLNMLSSLKDWVKEFDLTIFSFCFMPNHYHILLKINKPNLSKAMQCLNTSYGMRFNKKYQRKGHVFCGVYRASICLDDMHFIGSSFYIHLNPQKARIVEDALDYRWSSVNLYNNPEIKSFVKNDLILGIINNDLRKAALLYKDMLKEYSYVKYENIIENPKAGINFAKGIFKSLSKTLQNRNIKKDFIGAEINLDDMIAEFKKKEQKKTPEEKKGLIYLVEQLKSRGYNVTERAKILNVSRQALYSLTNKVEP